MNMCQPVKAAFHYSSQLQTWLQTWFSSRPGLQPGFRQVLAGLRHAFDQLLTLFSRKTGCEPQQVRWFMRVLDKWNVEKTRFKQVCSWLSTCFRRACDQFFDQVCSWLE